VTVTVLILALFLVVGALLGYGAVVFGREDRNAGGETPAGGRVNMRREVLWTGVAAALLLLAFLYVR
jgi:heme/copper-type cytochrome/quinol oxidase subunit 2